MAAKKKRNYEEFEFQEAIRTYNMLHCNWIIYSIPDSRRATAKGYPDIIAIHPETESVFVAELKSSKGKLKPEQHVWLNFYSKHFPTYVWRPSDLEDIKRLLKHHQWPLENRYTDVVERYTHLS